MDWDPQAPFTASQSCRRRVLFITNLPSREMYFCPEPWLFSHIWRVCLFSKAPNRRGTHFHAFLVAVPCVHRSGMGETYIVYHIYCTWHCIICTYYTVSCVQCIHAYTVYRILYIYIYKPHVVVVRSYSIRVRGTVASSTYNTVHYIVYTLYYIYTVHMIYIIYNIYIWYVYLVWNLGHVLVSYVFWFSCIHWFPLIFIVFNWFSHMYMDFHWLLVGFHIFSWISLIFSIFLLLFVDFHLFHVDVHRFSLIFIDFW